MNNQCTDRDLLAIEPLIFVNPFLTVGQLASGQDGLLAGTTFTSPSSDFSAGGIAAGMVACVRNSGGYEPAAYEIVSVLSTHSLCLSLLRSDAQEAAAIAPPGGSGLRFYIYSYRPQIRSLADSLAEKLRAEGETSGLDVSVLAGSAQFRRAVALGALADIFESRAANPVPDDVNLSKAKYYRKQFDAAIASFRLAAGQGGGGSRGLGQLRLRRD